VQFSILIPSWNNLPFLQLCVQSIKSNSTFSHQIIVHVNEGSDGTLQWVKDQKLDYSTTAINEGVCLALNLAAKLAKHDYIVFMNDDMFTLPDWDNALAKEIEQLNTDCFLFSSTMIEPYDTGNKCVIVANYGRSAEDFQRAKLLKEFKALDKSDWSGSTWPPAVVHKKWWERVGGYSEEFSPGMGSDDDFAMKMWNAGCRIYKGVASSRVYHFISKSTGRVVKNDGKKQFLKKWGIKQSTFHKYYLKRGEPYQGELKEPAPSLGLMFQKGIARIKKS
jgi:GT2 family glycosyltransferase